MSNSSNLIKKHFKDAQESFPKLELKWWDDENKWVILGDLDIRGEAGEYRGTFRVGILVDLNYPYSIPTVLELSSVLERDDDWHISKNGLCCLDIPHNLKNESKKGIHIERFIREVVYPYFANQLFRQISGSYANGEWLHGKDGIIQYYSEEFDLRNSHMALRFLTAVKNNTIPGRNDDCLCGEMKFKKCLQHYNAVEKLKKLSTDELEVDIAIFTKRE